VPCALRPFLVTALLAAMAGTVAAQTTTLSPSPTLPSDTLEANSAPRSAPGPTPALAPSLPSDTLAATQPTDSSPADSFPADSIGGASSSQAEPDELLPDATPVTPGDSAALRELKSWIRHHPEMAVPPPERAVLAKV